MGQESKSNDMDVKWGSLAAIIVAAGFSSRMKSFKPLLPLGESTVVEKAVEGFVKAGIKDILVVVGHRAEQLLPILDRLPVRTIYNTNFSEGMFSSICAGVKGLTPEVEAFFLLPVDNPIVNPSTLIKLKETFYAAQAGIIYPNYQGMRGHPPLISSRYVNDVLSWDKPGGMRAILDQYENNALDLEVDDQGILLDMDTPDDYQRMLKYYEYTRENSQSDSWRIRNADI